MLRSVSCCFGVSPYQHGVGPDTSRSLPCSWPPASSFPGALYVRAPIRAGLSVAVGPQSPPSPLWRALRPPAMRVVHLQGGGGQRKAPLHPPKATSVASPLYTFKQCAPAHCGTFRPASPALQKPLLLQNTAPPLVGPGGTSAAKFWQPPCPRHSILPPSAAVSTPQGVGLRAAEGSRSAQPPPRYWQRQPEPLRFLLASSQ